MNIEARMVLDAAVARGQRTLGEHDAKQVLAAYGIPVTRERLITSETELVAALPSFELPLVLKIDSPDILHKTEAGMVELGCRTPGEVMAAYGRIIARARDHYKEATINGVLLQEMVTGHVAECIVGMKKDPQFGPIIMFGLGGIFVEVFEDVSLRAAPLSRSDAAEMIHETKGHKILAGARGRPKADLRAIEEVLLKMSDLALELEDSVAEIDVNPLLVLPEGESVKAADALIILEGTT